YLISAVYTSLTGLYMKLSLPQKFNSLQSLYHSLVNTGIHFTMPPGKQMYIRMTNKLNLFYIFIVSIPTIWTFINLSNHGLNGYIRFVILIVFAAFNIYINSLYKHITAKVLTIAAPFFLIFITPAFNGFVHSGMFIWFPYGLIVIGSFSFFIFSLDDKREKFNNNNAGFFCYCCHSMR